MLPLLLHGAGQVTELKISAALLKLVPFQYRLSLFRLMLTPIVRELLLLLKLTAPQTPVGLQPELKVLVEYVPPFAGKVTLEFRDDSIFFARRLNFFRLRPSSHQPHR